MSLTIQQLYDVLGEMMDEEGIDPMTPVKLRILPKGPNAPEHASTIHEPEDVWHDPSGVVYIDDRDL